MDTSKIEGFFDQIKKASSNWASFYNPGPIEFYDDILGSVRSALIKQAVVTNSPIVEENGESNLKIEDILPNHVVVYRSPNVIFATNEGGVILISKERKTFSVIGKDSYVTLMKRLNESLAT